MQHYWYMLRHTTNSSIMKSCCFASVPTPSLQLLLLPFPLPHSLQDRKKSSFQGLINGQSEFTPWNDKTSERTCLAVVQWNLHHYGVLLCMAAWQRFLKVTVTNNSIPCSNRLHFTDKETSVGRDEKKDKTNTVK